MHCYMTRSVAEMLHRVTQCCSGLLNVALINYLFHGTIGVTPCYPNVA